MSKMSDLFARLQAGPTKRVTFVSHSERPWWVGPSLLLIMALYILPIAGSPAATNPNEVIRIELAVSIAYWAQLELGPAAEVYGLSEDISIRDGKIYSDKAPGLSIVSAPLVWIVDPVLSRTPSTDLPDYWELRHVLTFFLIALPTVALAFLVGATLPKTSPGRRTAAAVVAALATPLWTYGTVFFGHAPAAFAITLAWFLLLGLPARKTILTGRRAALGGMAAGLAVATEYPTVLLVAVIFASLLVRRTATPILAAAVAGAFAGALPAMIYHHVAFGAPWVTGYAFKAAADFQAIHAQGLVGLSWPSVDSLWGILFGSSRGIIFYSPILLLTPVGLWWFIHRHGWRDAGPILIAIAGYVCFAASFVDWPAGWCAAARHLVPIVPLAASMALFAATRLARRKWGAVVVVVLTAASGTSTMLTIVLTPFFPPEFGAPLSQLVLPSLEDGAAFSNLISSASGVAPVAIVILTGAFVIAALIWASGKLFRDRAWWQPVVALITIAVILLLYSWQGSAPSDEIELIRAQMLRRLGHAAVADHIEGSLISDVAP